MTLTRGEVFITLATFWKKKVSLFLFALPAKSLETDGKVAG